jgi:transposase
MARPLQRISRAQSEAEDLFRLVERRVETPQKIRALIGGSTERRKILTAFDALLVKHGYARRVRRRGRGRRFTVAEEAEIKRMILTGKPPIEILRRFRMTRDALLYRRKKLRLFRDFRRKPPVPDEVRQGVLRLLEHHSVRRIQSMLLLSQRTVRAIADSIGGAAAKKTSGRGRRISSTLRQDIATSLQAGLPRQEIRARFGVSFATINKIRRDLGIRDRRRDRKLTEEQVQEIRAALAARTSTWKALAAEFGVCVTVIGSVHRRERGYEMPATNCFSPAHTALLRPTGECSEKPGAAPAPLAGAAGQAAPA